jgi:hypothetical protein
VEGHTVEDHAILSLNPGEAIVFMSPIPKGRLAEAPEVPAPFKVYFPLFTGISKGALAGRSQRII